MSPHLLGVEDISTVFYFKLYEARLNGTKVARTGIKIYDRYQQKVI